MTITLVDCDTLQIVDDLITAFIADLPSPAYTLELKVNLGGKAETVIELTASNTDTVNGRFNLTPALISQTDDFTEGVYSVMLVKTNSDGTTSRSAKCYYLDCNETCTDLVAHVADNPTTNIGVLLYALKNMNVCEQVECTEYYDIYTEFKEMLETNDCGC